MSHYSITLGSPIYCLVFIENDQFICGGGGGSSKSGISNKLWLIKLKSKSSSRTSKQEFSILNEFSLPNGFDSPMSLDFDRSTGLILSGINSPLTDLKVGKNQHLRTFKLKDSSIEFKETYQILDFDQTGNDYQRINCLSRVTPQLLAVGGSNNQLKLLSYPSLKPAIQTAISCPAGELLNADFSEDGTHFLICSSQAIRIFLINYPSDKEKKTEIKLKQLHELIPPESNLTTIFRSAKFGRGLRSENIYTILNSKDRKKGSKIINWNILNGRIKKSRSISKKPITSFDLSESGEFLGISSSDLSVSILDSLSLRPILSILHAHEFPVTSLKFSIDSNKLISTSADTTIRVIEIPKKRTPWRSSGLILLLITILIVLISWGLNFNQSTIHGSLKFDEFIDLILNKINLNS